MSILQNKNQYSCPKTCKKIVFFFEEWNISSRDDLFNIGEYFSGENRAVLISEQVERWKGNVLSPTEWGWYIKDNIHIFITITFDSATELLPPVDRELPAVEASNFCHHQWNFSASVALIHLANGSNSRSYKCNFSANVTQIHVRANNDNTKKLH